MRHYVLATLGERPAAVGMGIDCLQRRYTPLDEAVLLHTDPHHSGIKDALAELSERLPQEFPGLPVRKWELRRADGSSIVDIDTKADAEAYFRALLAAMQHYRPLGEIHLLASGGRKAMSMYTAIAANYILGERDRLWVVHAPQDIMQSGGYRVPPGRQEDVHLIDLPYIPSRMVPNADLEMILNQRGSKRDRWLQDCTAAERKLLEAMQTHPHATYAELGHILGKSERTVENQFASAVARIAPYYDIPGGSHRRSYILQILNGNM